MTNEISEFKTAAPVDPETADRQLAIYRELVTPAGDFRTRVLAEAEAEAARIGKELLSLQDRVRELTRTYGVFVADPPAWLGHAGQALSLLAPVPGVPVPEGPPVAQAPEPRPATESVVEAKGDAPAVTKPPIAEKTATEATAVALGRSRAAGEANREKLKQLLGQSAVPLGLGQITKAMGISQTVISRHLKILIEENAVEKAPIPGNTRFEGYRLAPAPTVADSHAATAAEQARIRDFAVSQMDLISPKLAAEAAGVTEKVALGALRALERRGVLSDESPAADMPLFAYVPVTSPGRAAELDAERARAAARNGSDPSEPVAGTGHGIRVSHKPTQEFIDAARKAGADVKLTGGDHVLISNPKTGERMILPKTPGSDSMDKNRKRLAAIGFKV